TTTRPDPIAAQAASRMEAGRSFALRDRPATAMTGSTTRARTFQTPVTTAIVVTRARSKPQDRAIEAVGARPTAPPPGSMFETEEPHTLRTSARVWLSPGIAPVMTKV